MKTSYILIGAGVLVVGYLLISSQKAATVARQKANTSGTAATLAGVGSVATGISSLWDSIFNSGNSTDASAQ